MTSYLEFPSQTGPVLIEVGSGRATTTPPRDETSTRTANGERNASLRRSATERVGELVERAASTFEQAVHGVITAHVGAFVTSADALERPPAEMQIVFGLKGVGGVGNVAVAQLSGEVNYQVTMTWRSPDGANTCSPDA